MYNENRLTPTAPVLQMMPSGLLGTISLAFSALFAVAQLGL